MQDIWKQLPKYTFLVGIGLLPLIFWPWAQIPYEIPKVNFVVHWAQFLVVLTLLKWRSLPFRKLKISLLGLIFLWVVITVFASIWGVDPEKSFLGNRYRQDGLITLFHLVGLGIVVALNWKKDWRNPFSWFVVVGNTLTSLTIFFFPPWPDGSRGGVFGQPNFLAGYFLITLPFNLYLLAKTKTQIKWLVLLMLLVQLVAMYLTYSYVALIGVVGLGLFWFAANKGKVKLLLLSLIVGIVFAFGVGIYWWNDLHSREQITNPTLVIAESRERIYTKLLLAALKKPILGYGWANVDYAFKTVDWPIKLNNDVYVDKAHSHLIETFVTTGGFGLLIYLFLIGYLIAAILRRKEENIWKNTLISVLVLLLVHSQTNVVSVGEEVFFWMLVGYIAKN